jgi:hypothetical protein
MSDEPPPEITAAQAWVQILAAAYELEPEEVIRDARLAAAWHGPEHELHAILRDRHAWDASLTPYYVPALFEGLRAGHESK